MVLLMLLSAGVPMTVPKYSIPRPQFICLIQRSTQTHAHIYTLPKGQPELLATGQGASGVGGVCVETRTTVDELSAKRTLLCEELTLGFRCKLDYWVLGSRVTVYCGLHGHSSAVPPWTVP